MFKGLKPIIYGGREVWPLIEGGKGVSATNHASSGAWAAAGGIGTVSAVNADSYDENGNVIPQIYHGRTRAERHQELIRYGIEGGVAQVKRAFEIAGGQGVININVLWEMGGAQQILHGILERTRGMVAGVTCELILLMIHPSSLLMIRRRLRPSSIRCFSFYGLPRQFNLLYPIRLA